ncbi:uncharacterized protein FYW61_013240 [Anableps anableps]
MSSDIYSKVELPRKVRYTKKKQEDRIEWEEKEVNIYESAEDVADYYTVSPSQEEGQQTQRQPAARKSPTRRAKLYKILQWIVMLAVIILAIYFTLEISKVKNSYSHLQGKLSDMETNYSQLQSSYEIMIKNHSQLTDEVNRLNNTITGKWCPDGWTRFGSSCYFKSKETKTWSESRKHCQGRGADLVIINSEAEQDFVSQLNGNGESWIGLQTTWIEGKNTYDWQWVDGSPLTKA